MTITNIWRSRKQHHRKRTNDKVTHLFIVHHKPSFILAIIFITWNPQHPLLHDHHHHIYTQTYYTRQSTTKHNLQHHGLKPTKRYPRIKVLKYKISKANLTPRHKCRHPIHISPYIYSNSWRNRTLAICQPWIAAVQFELHQTNI